MRLLVVTPTLGQSPHLAAAIESVSGMGLDLEHLLVAPASAVHRLRRDFPRCTVVEEPSPPGMYAAIDAGARASGHWDWFTYLNDDDLLQPGFAELARAHMQSAKPDAIGYGDVEWIDERGRSLGRMPIEKRHRHVGYVMKLGLAPLTQQGAIVSRSLYTSLGGFNTAYRLAADFDFWVRAFAAGATFQYYPLTVASWRIHAAQASADRSAAHDQASRVAATVPVQASARRLGWELLRFRLLNAGRYLERRKRTGTWRTEDLFLAAAAR